MRRYSFVSCLREYPFHLGREEPLEKTMGQLPDGAGGGYAYLLHTAALENGSYCKQIHPAALLCMAFLRRGDGEEKNRMVQDNWEDAGTAEGWVAARGHEEHEEVHLCIGRGEE